MSTSTLSTLPVHRQRLLAGLCLAVACACALGSARAQLAPAGPVAGPQPTDPQRWYVDDATRQEQLRTLRKEIGAALQEAQKQCRQMAPSERDGCMKDAQATYQRDMARSEQLREEAHPPS